MKKKSNFATNLYGYIQWRWEVGAVSMLVFLPILCFILLFQKPHTEKPIIFNSEQVDIQVEQLVMVKEAGETRATIFVMDNNRLSDSEIWISAEHGIIQTSRDEGNSVLYYSGGEIFYLPSGAEQDFITISIHLYEDVLYEKSYTAQLEEGYYLIQASGK